MNRKIHSSSNVAFVQNMAVAGAALLVITVLMLAGCNTIEGVGEDTQAAGRGIEKAAESAKD